MKRQMIFILGLFLVQTMHFSCIKVDGINYSNNIVDLPTEVTRDRTPWAFRINLDERPRNLVLALHRDLWVTYDTENSGLHRAWTGGVNFNGIIYNNAHGVQPNSIGEPYIVDGLKKSPWRLTSDEGVETVIAEYEGYIINNNTIIIRYIIPINNDYKTVIEERPEFIRNTEGTLGLHREFEVFDLPKGYELSYSVSVNHLASPEDVHTNGRLIIDKMKINNSEWGSSVHLNGDLFLKRKGKTSIQTFFPTGLYNLNEKILDDGKELIATTPINDLEMSGKDLIGSLGCVACHYVEKPLLGPSYNDVAKKYDNSDESKRYLIEKIQTGGKGVWGERLMPPHPHINEKTASEIANFILSLDQLPEGEYLPGVAIDFFDIGTKLERQPKLLPGQDPNVSQVFPEILFQSGNPDIGWENQVTDDFLHFERNFIMKVSGYLQIEEAGDYEFRFIADKGGSLKIDEEKIAYVNNIPYTPWQGGDLSRFNEFASYLDKEPEVGKLTGAKFLTKGFHKIDIDYYQNLLTMALILQWRKKGEQKFEFVPKSALFHDPRDIKPTSSGLKEIYKLEAPGHGGALVSVHPSFDLIPARPPNFEPRVGGMDFLPNGDLAVATWDGEVFIVSNVSSGDPSRMSFKQIAEGLCEPLGLAVADGDIYVMQRWELTKLVDQDGDGITDYYHSFSDDWSTRPDFHAWGFGLTYKDGYFYTNTGPSLGPYTKKQAPDAGKTLKISITDGSFQAIAHGYKAPNGIGIGYGGDIFTTDNEGTEVPTSKLMHVDIDNPEEYPFFGNSYVLGKKADGLEIKPPVVWTPQNEIGNSPSEPGVLNVGPYKNQMIMGDARHGGLKRVFIEEVDGLLQGALFRFTQGLEAGINRFVWGPDSSLYVGGVGGTNDFTWEGKRFGLEKLTYNGKSAFEMLAVRAKSNGMEIELTESLRVGDGAAPNDYLVQQWWYDIDTEGGIKQELENLVVKSVSISSDKKRIFLEIDGLKPDRVVYINFIYPVLSVENQQLWSSEVWYTLNNIPSYEGVVEPTNFVRMDNNLSEEERKDGWQLLFDGESMSGWNGTSSNKSSDGWEVVEGLLSSLTAGNAILTEAVYDNFELEFQWKVEEGSDGGIFFRVPESIPVEEIQQAFPEMQIIDDQNNPDASVSQAHVTGAAYDILPPTYLIAKPAGNFNHSRIFVSDNQVQHWINGIKILDYSIGGKIWNQGFENSLYKDNSNFGSSNNGHIVIANQEGKIWLKNIRLRSL